jgi:hypothetical protein
MPRAAVAIVLVLAGVLAAWLALRDRAPSGTPSTAREMPSSGPSQAPRGDAHEPGGDGDAAAAPRSRSPAAARKTERDRVRRDALRAEIAARRATSGAGPRARPSDEARPAEAPPAEPVLDKDYIQSRIREDLVPIAKECYETALEDQPDLAGKLVMKFAIVGEPDVGGVVDAAEIDPSSTLVHPDLHECMRESMMSLSFAPPDQGGTVQVTYPFEFAPQ